MSIVFKIEAYLGRKPNFTEEIKLRNDGSGDYISEWNISSEKSKPTDAQLDALESEATKLENNNKIISTRKKLYGTLEQQMENIIEKGLQSEVDRVNQIKLDNPKS